VADEHGAWAPLRPDEVAGLLAGAPFPWWVAGGWAIDLFVGAPTRQHADIDVQVLRRDRLAVRAALPGWELHLAGLADAPGELRLWEECQELPLEVHNLWCRPRADAPWALQLMLLDAEGDGWLFRRDRRIGGPLSAFGRRDAAGVPYVAPEVQLLYKSKHRLPKDEADLAAALPRMDATARRWLAEALELCSPGHPWANLARRPQGA
jgi:hypothetical protein